jgi:hypothetical protein
MRFVLNVGSMIFFQQILLFFKGKKLGNSGNYYFYSVNLTNFAMCRKNWPNFGYHKIEERNKETKKFKKTCVGPTMCHA